MKIKRVLCLLLCLCCMAPMFLVGCGGGDGDFDVDINPVDDGDLVFDANNKIVYDNVSLKMWSVTTGDDANTQDAIIARFNQEYAGLINVTTEHKSRYDLESAIQTTIEFKKSEMPDLLFSHGSRANEYAVKNWLLPLNAYLDKAGITFDKDDYVESLVSATTVKEGVFGLPQDVHSAMIVYRKDILERNGFAVPTDYQELVAVCDAAVEKAAAGELEIRGENSSGYPATEWRKAPSGETYYPFPMAYGDMWVHEFLGYTVAAQNGGEFVAADGMPGFNNQKTADGLQVLRELIYPSETSTNRKPLSKDLGTAYDVGNIPLRQGNAIFKLLGPWEYQSDLASYDALLRGDVDEQGNEKRGSDNIGTISMSKFFAKDQSQPYAKSVKGEGHAFMMFSTTTSRTKQCAAMVFADWMVNNAGIEWAKRGHLPSLKSVENSSEYRSDPAYNAYIKNWGSCDDYIVIQPTPYYSNIDASFKECVKKSMVGQYRTSSILSILQEEYDDCVDYIELYA